MDEKYEIPDSFHFLSAPPFPPPRILETDDLSKKAAEKSDGTPFTYEILKYKFLNI